MVNLKASSAWTQPLRTQMKLNFSATKIKHFSPVDLQFKCLFKLLNMHLILSWNQWDFKVHYWSLGLNCSLKDIVQ